MPGTGKKSQVQKFQDLARRLGAHDEEERFTEAMKKITGWDIKSGEKFPEPKKTKEKKPRD